ncbi:MAG TPA: HNH endonuclease [Patescibacteria group bacterium]
MVKKFCIICKKQFFVHKYRLHTALACSLSCRSKYIQITHPNLRKTLPHKFGKEHPHWNGGKWTDHQGYIHLRLPNYPQSNPRGYYREHRYVMEQHLGRFLKRSEHIHHINGNKQDNRIENLELFKNAMDHANHHISLNGSAHN